MRKLAFTYQTKYTFDIPIYEHYYTLKIYPRENERQYIQELLAYKIEGLIVLSFTIPSEELTPAAIENAKELLGTKQTKEIDDNKQTI